MQPAIKKLMVLEDILTLRRGKTKWGVNGFWILILLLIHGVHTATIMSVP